MYTIGQVSEMFGIPVSTLRYYDKEGLFPDMERESGIRKFGERELAQLHLIECLKKSGLEIKDIRQFMQWCREGSVTYEKRLGLMRTQKESVMREIGRMNEVLDMIEYKCWYYETAAADGNEVRAAASRPEDMPEEVRNAYERLFK
ncbi:MAG: MerR family transcriptional regulator [Clostridiales bacterium]|nr:MerR family transcriptional regulator [Clostridiales bacterium]